jgi:hypothetical protein
MNFPSLALRAGVAPRVRLSQSPLSLPSLASLSGVRLSQTLSLALTGPAMRGPSLPAGERKRITPGPSLFPLPLGEDQGEGKGVGLGED